MADQQPSGLNLSPKASKSSNSIGSNSETIKSSHFVMTKNDSEWAKERCTYLFDKYIKGLKETDQVNIEALITGIFKDLKVLFRIDEDVQLRDRELRRFSKNPIQSFKKFEEKLYEWIEEFREQSVSTYLGEGISIVTNAFKEHEEELENFLSFEEEKESNSLNITNLPLILPKVFSMIEVRLLCLDNIVPKDDSALIQNYEEQEYCNILMKAAEEHYISIINSDNMK